MNNSIEIIGIDHQRPRVMPQLMSLSGMKAIRDLSTPLPILTECLETLIFPLTASAYQRVCIYKILGYRTMEIFILSQQ